MSVVAKRKIEQEDIESKPKGKKQSTRVKAKKSAKKPSFKPELQDEEVFAMDLARPPSNVNQILKKDAQFVQVNVIGVHLIAQTLDFYKEDWSYVDTAININGTCWIILEKKEEE